MHQSLHPQVYVHFPSTSLTHLPSTNIKCPSSIPIDSSNYLPLYPSFHSSTRDLLIHWPAHSPSHSFHIQQSLLLSITTFHIQPSILPSILFLGNDDVRKDILAWGNYHAWEDEIKMELKELGWGQHGLKYPTIEVDSLNAQQSWK